MEFRSGLKGISALSIYLILAGIAGFPVLLCIDPAQASTNSGFAVGESTENVSDSSVMGFIKKNFGLSYNSFFSGPGFGQSVDTPPALTGTPGDSGLNFFNYISAKYKIGNGLAIDVQFRNEVVVTNQVQFRNQGQRFGISGTLIKGNDWSISGAVNTDLPIGPLMGQINTQRTLVFDPGMFASFNWEPKGSRWSVFALLAPRVWFYRNNNALAIQDTTTGGIMAKPQIDLLINPSINYRISSSLGWRFGTTIEFLKNVGWSSIRRNYMPLETGITWDITDKFGIYTYVTTSTPLDDGIRSYQLNTSSPPNWAQTASVNLWIYGTVF